eukprot:g12283.t1
MSIVSPAALSAAVQDLGGAPEPLSEAEDGNIEEDAKYDYSLTKAGAALRNRAAAGAQPSSSSSSSAWATEEEAFTSYGSLRPKNPLKQGRPPSTAEKVDTTSFLERDLIQTRTGNLISRRAVLFGSQNIELRGSGCVISGGVTLRGDLALLRFGEFCIVEGSFAPRPPKSGTSSAVQVEQSEPDEVPVVRPGLGTIVRPSRKLYQHVYVALKFGDFVRIGHSCVVQAASIGSNVDIGHHAVIGNRVVIHSQVIILPYTVVPENEVIPPFSVVSGAPMRVVSSACDLPAKVVGGGSASAGPLNLAAEEGDWDEGVLGAGPRSKGEEGSRETAADGELAQSFVANWQARLRKEYFQMLKGCSGGEEEGAKTEPL